MGSLSKTNLDAEESSLNFLTGCWATAFAGPQELNILLVGPRRTGKSSTGNTLLGQGKVFETRGGETSTAASVVTAGRHMIVVDAQGWGPSEEFVPQEEKTELLKAVSLCRPGGPHIVVLVIPLLDFTEPERRAVERRMEMFTSTVWRHTMVLLTCGDLLRRSGCSVEEHIQSGGPALWWLMEKCCYRYHVFDNKADVISKQESRKQEVKGGGKSQPGSWQWKLSKGAGRKSTEGKADGRKEGEQEQVTELLRKVDSMLQENGGLHLSLHMYQRLEEEWKCREQELRARLEAETDVRRTQKTAETKINMEQEQGLETEEEQADSLRKEQQSKQECVKRKMNIEGDEEERELKTLSSEEDWWDTSSSSGGESDESTYVKTGNDGCLSACWRSASKPVRRLS